MTRLELAVLGRILMLQSALHAAPDRQRLGELVCYALVEVPGVDATALYIDGQLISSAESSPGRAQSFPPSWPQTGQSESADSGDFISLPLQTNKGIYGFLTLLVGDRKSVQEYLPHLENTVNLMALMLENRQQAAELQALNRDLEAQVKERVKALQRSEDRLSLALIGAKSGIWDWNLQNGKVFFDANYFKIAGYEPDEFPHSFAEWRARVHPEDLESTEAQIADYLAGRLPRFAVEFRFKTKQGRWMWILGQGIVAERDEAGAPIRFTGTHTDIDERKQSVEALRSSEANLRATLDSIGDAVIATDAERRVVRMNPVAEKLTGWTAAQAEGQSLESVFQLVDAIERTPINSTVAAVLADGEPAYADNSLLIAKNGSEHLVAESGAPIRNANNRLDGVVLVFRDVTEEKALQEQLQQSRKMDTIGRLAGGVAHDFNNMLGGIIGATELLKRRLPADPKTEKFLGMIMESAERAADLTTKLLAFARKQHVSSSPVDVHQVLKNAISLLESTVDRRIRISTDLAAEAHMVSGDLTQLQNAFLNLCINAVQAMPEGGTLFIASQVLDLEPTDCAASSFDLQPGVYLELEFRDSGCGISPENLQRIFEPFFTTKGQGKGTGLGLAAVLGTIQMHHGAVTAYSEVGAGSAFQVLLPLSEEEAESHDSLAPVVCGSGLILIVDDEAVMRATAAAILEDLGYEVLLAENGCAGLELFKQRQTDIDLVLLDMIMPEMNGRDCFYALRKISPAVRVVLCSGFTRSDELVDLRAAGLTGYLRKPYRSATLSRTVAAALSQGDMHNALWG